MFDFIEKVKLKIRQSRERRELQKHQDEKLKIVIESKQFEIDKLGLERESELEGLKAGVRKKQQKSLPKPGQQKDKKKTAFASFQNYCDDFTNQPSAFGGINGKKNNKGSRKGNKSGIGRSFFSF